MNLQKILAIVSVMLLSRSILIAKSDTSLPTKKTHFVLSAGIGFPSILGYFLVKNANKDIQVIKTTNPFMAKAEMQKKRWGVGITYTTNFQQFHLLWANTNPQLIDNNVINTWSVGLRGNAYLINKSFTHQINNIIWHNQLQVYIGGGAGYIKTTQKTQTLNFPYPPTVSETFGRFPMSFEATIGTRYFINQHVGVFFEAGLGNSPIQLIDKGASDSYVQSGISVRF